MATDTSTAGTPLDHALQHAALGFPLIPLHSIDSNGRCSCGCADATCGSRGKHPRIRDWQHSATVDPVLIRRWWSRWPDANVGHVTATDELHDVVLDVDTRHGGDATLAQLVTEHDALPAGPTTKTGSGGWHYYFEASPEQLAALSKATGNRSGNSAGLLGPGLDIRAERGQVVLPPSRSRAG